MDDALEERHATKDKVVEAALLHSAFDGWSDRALVSAAKDAGIDRGTAKRLFPRGGASLLDWLDEWLDRQMLASVDAVKLADMPVRRRVAVLVRARLEPLAGHQEAMRRAAAARGLPKGMLQASRSTWHTADRIWEAAGFPSTATEGVSRYTRRALLSGILVSTFLFWLEDSSDGHRETWSFLDRRIDNALTIGKLTARLGRVLPGGRRGSATTARA